MIQRISSQFVTNDDVVVLLYKLYDISVLTLVYLPVCLDFGHLFSSVNCSAFIETHTSEMIKIIQD